MDERPADVNRALAAVADPRVRSRYLRTVRASGDSGAVALVGVVHDHPASVARVEAVVEALAPTAVALEVPAIALPSYVAQAGQQVTGGEISAAIHAAPAATAVGIDVPGPGFIAQVWRYLRTESPGPDVALGLVHRASTMARRAAARRFAGWRGHDWGRRGPTRCPLETDGGAAAGPAEQAADEVRAVGRSRSVLRAVETPPAVAALDDVREAYMAARLAALRHHPCTVAVVGLDHLDAVHAGVLAA